MEITGEVSYSIYKENVKTRRDGGELSDFGALPAKIQQGWKALDDSIICMRNMAIKMGYDHAMKQRQETPGEMTIEKVEVAKESDIENTYDTIDQLENIIESQQTTELETI